MLAVLALVQQLLEARHAGTKHVLLLVTVAQLLFSWGHTGKGKKTAKGEKSTLDRQLRLGRLEEPRVGTWMRFPHVSSVAT